MQSSTTQTLIEQVQALPSAKAIEAAKIVASSIAGEPDLSEEEFEAAFGDPLAQIGEMDRLARIVLINAAQQPEYEKLVENAVANSGKKQLVLGGTELIALGVLAIAALRIIVNPVSKKVISYTDESGRQVNITEERNNDTNFLTKVFERFLVK